MSVIINDSLVGQKIKIDSFTIHGKKVYDQGRGKKMFQATPRHLIVDDHTLSIANFSVFNFMDALYALFGGVNFNEGWNLVLPHKSSLNDLISLASSGQYNEFILKINKDEKNVLFDIKIDNVPFSGITNTLAL
jgi:hypothetical protein